LSSDLAAGNLAGKFERPGIEHLFPRMPKTQDLMLDNVGLSWVALDGDDHAANRFFLEDLAIGLMRPILNVDVERLAAPQSRNTLKASTPVRIP